MKFFLKIVFFSFIFINNASANQASKWLNEEIEIILNAYKNTNLSKEEKFLIVEDTVNYNFAGTGIAKFVLGDVWKISNKENKKEYIRLFKRHLALSIASMMQGYSNQTYQLRNNKYDSKNKVSLIDMEIFNDIGSLIVTWRVKSSKERFYVIDLLVADISLVVTKRSEFNSMLKNVNYDLNKLNVLLEKQNNESYKKLIN
jgi:ABC-type transporter MlaC component